MSEQDCNTWPAGVVGIENGRTVWIETPPHTHVSTELVDDTDAMAFIESRYEIGERCTRPGAPAAFHAHAKTEEAPDARA